jgi:histone-binding protein RBBP4
MEIRTRVHKRSMQVVDFQWNPHDPWTMMSVSDDVGEGGGGTLQLWRLSDLVYRPDEEVLQELEQYR